MIKILYLLSPKIRWKTFKKLQELVKEDIVAVGGDKAIWQMVRDKQIYCWFCEELPNDMGIGLKLPEYKKLIILK